MADPSYDLGNYSFLAGPDGAGAATASTAAPPDGVDYEKGATPLYRAIEARDWSAAVSRVRHHPSEAKMWVYRLRPDGVTVRWRVLPLHQACAREPPPSILYALLAAHPDAASSFNPLGDATEEENAENPVTPMSPAPVPGGLGPLPIHYASRWGAAEEVVRILAAAYPDGLSARDHRGYLPVDLARMRVGKSVNAASVVRALEDLDLERRTNLILLDEKPSAPLPIGEESMIPLNDSTAEEDVNGIHRTHSRMSMNSSVNGSDFDEESPDEGTRSRSSSFASYGSEAEFEEKTEDLVRGEGWRKAGLAVVVVGASGDLAKKKTYPSLLNLYDDNLLPETTVIWGYARSGMSHDDLRDRLRPYLLQSGDHDEEVVEEFLSRCYYKRGKGYGDLDAFAELNVLLGEHEQTLPELPSHNRLFYLAIPPSAFGDAGVAIKATCMGPSGWSRVIVEKPFGHDLESCEKLLAMLDNEFDESQMFRIDHYLGKEMVQNLMVLRFGNTWFERLFSRDDVQCVMITFKEPFGTDGRGGYFDNIGIVRDIVQNHLLQVLTLLAMEAPIKADGPDAGEKIRDAKSQILQAIPPITIDEVLLGQYDGYADDPTIENKDTCTPTYVALRVFIHTPRWAGVPFIFKAGKCLNERRAECRIQFKDSPAASFMFDTRVPRNELVLRIQPNEAVYIKTNLKSPGFKSGPVQAELEVNYDKRYYQFASESNPDAYTRLILDVLRGRSANFVRKDELLRAWEIFTPLLHQIESKKIRPLPYARGSRGPAEADAWINMKSGYIRNKDYMYYGEQVARKSRTRRKMALCDIGIFGIDPAGEAFALNVATKGFNTCIIDGDLDTLKKTKLQAKKEGITAHVTAETDITSAIAKLKKPRRLVIFPSAVNSSDMEKLSELLEPGDVAVEATSDSRTSPDSLNSLKILKDTGVETLGMGIIEAMADERDPKPVLNVHGSKEAYEMMADILTACAADEAVHHTGPQTVEAQ